MRKDRREHKSSTEGKRDVIKLISCSDRELLYGTELSIRSM